MKKSQDKSSKVAEILPQPKEPQGLSSASMQSVMKAASENPRPRPTLRAQNRQPQNAPSISGASLQMLQTFAAEAEAKGPQQARTSQVPTPEMGLPVSQSQGTTSQD